MTPTTKLEAVNLMLSTIGEAPVNSLPTGLAEGAYAETLLNEISRSVQAKGWAFNTNLDYEIALSPEGYLVLPNNVLSVDTQDLRRKSDTDVVQRGNKLYDRIKNTFVFTSPLKVTMVIGLDFEDLPETARRYISLKAARTFYDRYNGWNVSTAHSVNTKFTLADEMDAWVEMLSNEGETEDYNILDNTELAMTLSRTTGR